MTQCIICLEEGGCCLWRVCSRKTCNFRVHWLCYLRWYFNDNYRPHCPCGCYINTYSFCLPPSFKTLEAISRQPRSLAREQVEVSISNRLHCKNTETKFYLYLVLYFTSFFILSGYLGKLLLWKIWDVFHFDFWSLNGFCYHFMGWLLTCLLLSIVKVLLVEPPTQDNNQISV